MEWGGAGWIERGVRVENKREREGEAGDGGSIGDREEKRSG